MGTEKALVSEYSENLALVGGVVVSNGSGPIKQKKRRYGLGCLWAKSS